MKHYVLDTYCFMLQGDFYFQMLKRCLKSQFNGVLIINDIIPPKVIAKGFT